MFWIQCIRSTYYLQEALQNNFLRERNAYIIYPTNLVHYLNSPWKSGDWTHGQYPSSRVANQLSHTRAVQSTEVSLCVHC